MLTRACGHFAGFKSAPDICVRCGWPLAGHGQAPATPATLRTMRAWGDTVKLDVCRSPQCRQPIFFIQHTKTGNFMPFDGRPRPLAIEHEIGTGREIWLLDLAASHFASCVSAKAFRGGRR